MAVIGIDFGTTQSKMACIDDFGRARSLVNSEGEEITPTVVSFEDNGDPIIGRQAANEALARPGTTFRDFKLKLGSKEVLYTSPTGEKYTATDLTELVLGKLKRDAQEGLGEEVKLVVISVPANFQDDQKSELLTAAKSAGLDVLSLIPEPTAAGVAYGLEKGQDQTVLISDLGGGTYDASIVRSKGERIEVLGTAGIADLGGRRYTEIIEAYSLDALARETGLRPNLQKDPALCHDLHDRAEQAKFALGVKGSAKLMLSAGGQYHTVELTREEFERAIANLICQIVEKAGELLKDCGLRKEDLDRILLVGGGNKIPSIKAAMEKAFGRPVAQDIDPIRAVAWGAAIQAAIEASKGTGSLTFRGRAIPAPKLNVQDVTAHGIGCCVDDPNLNEINAVIVQRHTPIPCEHEDLFRLKLPDQTDAHIRVLQGEEGEAAGKCLTIGELTLKGLPPDPKLPKRIHVVYRLDGNAMCSAEAEDLVSGKKTQMRFDYSRGVARASAG